jgi:hypothetical protein
MNALWDSAPIQEYETFFRDDAQVRANVDAQRYNDRQILVLDHRPGAGGVNHLKRMYERLRQTYADREDDDSGECGQRVEQAVNRT